MKKTALNFMATLLVIASLIFSVSCDSQLEPDGTNLKIEMKAITEVSTLSNARLKNSGLVFHEVRVGLTELELETLEEDESEESEGEDENEEIEFEGEYTIDLINGTSTPDLGLAEIEPGVYEEIEMEFDAIMDDGNSVFISFDLPRENADPITIEFSSTEDFEIEIENEVTGIQIEPGLINSYLVSLDLDALFMGIDLGSAEVDNDGVIRINSEFNSSIARQIEAKLDISFEVEDEEEDDDDDDD